MKIKFLGTGAADWDVKNRKTEKGFRLNSSVLVNSDLLIDIPDHIQFCIEEGTEELGGVKNIVLTHSHQDHFRPASLEKLCGGQKIDLFCNEKCNKKIPDIENAAVNNICAGEKVNAEDYEIMPVLANHSVEDTGEDTYHYIISDKAGKTIFYGCDGAWLHNSAFKAIRQMKFDLVVLDGTLGDMPGDYRIFEHNDLTMVKHMADVFRKNDIMKEGGQIYISHLSKYAHKEHEEVCKMLKPSEIGVAYDGLELEI